MVHINRLKRAHGTGLEAVTPKVSSQKTRRSGTKQSKLQSSKLSEDESYNEISNWSTQPQAGTVGNENEDNRDPSEAPTASPVTSGQCDPDWDPGSLYMQRKLRADNSSTETAYQLRTRPVNRSRPVERRCEEPGSTSRSQNNQETVQLAQKGEQPNFTNPTMEQTGHSYNLRSRTHSAS